MAATAVRYVACPSCGAAAQVADSHCPVCGEALASAVAKVAGEPCYVVRGRRVSSPDATPISCQRCGHQVARRMARCIACGGPVSPPRSFPELQCPRCRGELRVAVSAWVAIERCTGCQGEFYEPGEFERTRQLGRKEIHWLARKLGLERRPTAEARAVPCPRCATVMETIDFGGEERCAVDRCPACKALWFDSEDLPLARNVVVSQPVRTLVPDAGARYYAGLYRENVTNARFRGDRYRGLREGHYDEDYYDLLADSDVLGIGACLLSELLNDEE